MENLWICLGNYLMGKKNRARRAIKKRKKIQRIKAQTKNKQDNKNISGPVFQMIESPFANFSDEKIKQLAEGMGKNSEKRFQESLTKIQNLLKKYDATTLLSILSAYGLTAAFGDDGIKPSANSNPLNQSHVEICQALALQVNPEEYGGAPVTPDVVQQAWDALIGIAQSFPSRRMTGKLVGAPEEQASIVLLQEWVRINTQTVRNWGYFSQVKIISKELYSFFDELLLEKAGFRASDVINVFDYMVSSIEETLAARINLLSELYRIKKPKNLVYKYYEIIGQSSEEAKTFIEKLSVESAPIKSIFAMLLSHYDLRLYRNYTFNPNNIEKALGISEQIVSAILEKFSYGIGGLSKFNTEHIFLANPIWYRPVIKLYKNGYFCPIPQLFFSFVLESFDKIIEEFDKDALHDRRANYLEEKIDEIVKRRFPEANTVKGINWKQGDVEYETDLITFIDSYAIVVEAKSVKITDPARRGAPDRLKRHIEEILIAPNEQSKRLRNRLRELIEYPSLDNGLRGKLPVKLEGIHKVLRISVSLEDFAFIQANVSRLKSTGWIPSDFESCPTMTLADFETLFDILEHPVQIIHYLERRAEIEGILKYVGDELDLIGWYIDTLFNFGNIHEENAELILSGESFLLDKYYNSKDHGVVLPKPTPKMSDLFLGILEQLEQRHTPRWTEIGAILHRFSPDDQNKLVRMVKELEKIVQENWMVEGHKNIIVYSPPKSSEYALCYVLYKNNNSERREEFLKHAIQIGLEPNHVKNCLVIAKNIDRNDMSYHFIGLAMKNKNDALVE